ncbi:Peroxiredoxin Q, chloroplastic [Gracilariopsis chorda]|uniref:thioredoxin-dependent peroxiredoxin n=1 Tax=Gracilariopsis chorda TaxID=448386 RepID=A0A2V3ITR3_9FLOR|nr:Peroxiredoxin Q, chloroplastic [Gracilariopsis chorda]|eukprot:PXF45117.1 Peroxiredoxin Q, chloroplastic [Gracilariopsis chorda]
MAFVAVAARSAVLASRPFCPRVCPRRSLFTAPRTASLRPSPTPHRALFSPPKMLAEGQPAPDFDRVDGDGNRIKLSELRGQNVILYFSNLAGPGCTSQSCTFRDAAEHFVNLNARVIAVSAQSDQKSADFKRINRLPFSVISDVDKQLQKLYNVPSTFGLIPGRVTFVIDKQGVVRKVFNSQFNATQHVAVAKETLSSLN